MTDTNKNLLEQFEDLATEAQEKMTPQQRRALQTQMATIGLAKARITRTLVSLSNDDNIGGSEVLQALLSSYIDLALQVPSKMTDLRMATIAGLHIAGEVLEHKFESADKPSGDAKPTEIAAVSPVKERKIGFAA